MCFINRYDYIRIKKGKNSLRSIYVYHERFIILSHLTNLHLFNALSYVSTLCNLFISTCKGKRTDFKKPLPSTEITLALDKIKKKRKSKLNHGSSGPNIKRRATDGEVETPAQFFLRNMSNFKVSLSFCVTDNSHQTYGIGERHFYRYCLTCDIDPKLQVIPLSLQGHFSSEVYMIMTVGSFMSYLAVTKGLCPNTISTYTSGVRDSFRRDGRPFVFFSDYRIKQMRMSLQIEWREAHEEKIHTETLPFTLDMLSTFDRLTTRGNMEEEAQFCCAQMQLANVLRCSECVPTAADHHIRGQDVKFIMQHSDGSTFRIHPIDACKYNLEGLISVEITVRSMKNDQDSLGYLYPHARRVIGEKVQFCLATTMYVYASRAKPLNEDPFLSYLLPDGHRRWLGYESYNTRIKQIAVACGFKGVNFSTHSLRIGGATLIAAAGHPNHYVRGMLRSKSDSYLGYIHLAMSSILDSQLSLVDPSIYTMRDMLRLNPTASISYTA